MKKKLLILAFAIGQIGFLQAQNDADKKINESPEKAKSEKISLKTEATQFYKGFLLDEIKLLSQKETEAIALSHQLSADTEANPIDIQRTNIELETYNLQKERKYLQLERVEAKIAKSELPEERNSAIETRFSEIETRLRELQRFDRDLADEQRLESGTEFELQARRAELVARQKIVESQLKAAGSSMKPTKKYALKNELKSLEEKIERYNEELGD